MGRKKKDSESPVKKVKKKVKKVKPVVLKRVEKPSNVIEFKLRQNEKKHEEITVSEVSIWLSKKSGMPDFLREQVELYATQKQRVSKAISIMERLGIPSSDVSDAIRLQQELLDRLRKLAVEYEVNMEDDLEAVLKLMKVVD